MQEIRLYTAWEFIKMVLFGLVAIVGVFIIVKKPKWLSKAKEDKEETPGELEINSPVTECKVCKQANCQLPKIDMDLQIKGYTKM